jgi:hypothetical protein
MVALYWPVPPSSITLDVGLSAEFVCCAEERKAISRKRKKKALTIRMAK